MEYKLSSEDIEDAFYVLHQNPAVRWTSKMSRRDLRNRFDLALKDAKIEELPTNTLRAYHDWGREVNKENINNPIIVVKYSNGYLLLDGQHRLLHFQRNNIPYIKAFVLDMPYITKIARKFIFTEFMNKLKNLTNLLSICEGSVSRHISMPVEIGYDDKYGWFIYGRGDKTYNINHYIDKEWSDANAGEDVHLNGEILAKCNYYPGDPGSYYEPPSGPELEIESPYQLFIEAPEINPWDRKGPTSPSVDQGITIDNFQELGHREYSELYKKFEEYAYEELEQVYANRKYEY